MHRSNSSPLPHRSQDSSLFSSAAFSRGRGQGWKLASGLGLLAIALRTFHAVSTLVFAVLGLAPSSPQWLLVPGLGLVLALAGAAAISPMHYSKPGQHLYGLTCNCLSGGACGAIVGFFYLGQLSEQQAKWAIAGALLGSLFFAGLAFWTSAPQPSTGLKRWCNAALVIMASICTYGFAFGSGAWLFAAISTGHWALAIPLGLLTLLYLWLTRRLWKRLTQQLREFF